MSVPKTVQSQTLKIVFSYFLSENYFYCIFLYFIDEKKLHKNTTFCSFMTRGVGDEFERIVQASALGVRF